MILASKEQIEEYTGKGCWGTRTLLDDFRDNVKNFSEQTAIIDPMDKQELLDSVPERPTWSEVGQAVDNITTALMDSGIGKDDVVMVQLPNCWELAALYFAIAAAGAVISPFPMQWRSKDVTYVAELTQAKAFISVESFHGFDHLAMGKEVARSVPSLDLFFSYGDIRRMIKQSPSRSFNPLNIDANEIFTICWTSGTESQPKGCPLSHNNWRFVAGLCHSATDTQPGEVLLTAVPMVNMTFVCTTLIVWLFAAGTLVIHHPFNPMFFLTQVIEEKVNFLGMVPALMNMLLQHPAVDDFDLSNIRFVGVGSAPPSHWAMREFKKRWNIDVGNVWGQNEGTGIFAGVKDIPEMELRVTNMPRYGCGHQWGSPLTEFIETKIVDVSGNGLEEKGAVGELCYRSPGVIPGYFQRPDLNKHAFDSEGFIRTGDLFQIKSDRFMQFFERSKDIIIRGGHNISAQEVENTIIAHSKIQEVAAVSIPDKNLGERTCVYVVLVPEQNISLDEITTFMEEQGVAIYKLPEHLEVVEALPRNPLGKIIKEKLRKDIREKLG